MRPWSNRATVLASVRRAEFEAPSASVHPEMRNDAHRNACAMRVGRAASEANASDDGS
jgi:hypothetical protein